MQKLLIADDHILVRLGVELLAKEVLGFNCIIDSVSNGKEIEKKLLSSKYDMLITDLNMPDTDGLELVALALRLQPELKILVVSVNPELVFASRYLRAGVYGYVQKGGSYDELKTAMYEISNGRRFVTSGQSQMFTNAFLTGQPSNPFDNLSTREFEVTLLLLKGYGILEISNALGINHSTVSTYRVRVFEKLQVKNIIDLSKLAMRYEIANDAEASH